MSGTPNRRPHEDGGNGSNNTGGSGSHSHPSVLKYPHDDQGTYSGTSGKVVVSSRHDYHAPYDIGQESRIPKTAPRSNESRDAERRSPLLPNMLFRVQTPNDSHSDHGSESRMDFRDSKDSTKVENRNMKSESRELPQTSKSDKYDVRADDCKEPKHERDTFSEPKGNEKLDKDAYSGSNSQLNRKDVKEQHRLKQYPDVPGGHADTWQTLRGSLHGPADAVKEGLHVDNKDFAEVREAVGENKVDTKGDDKFKDKDRKRKEGKHWDWGERDKERIDRRNNLQHGNNSNENKDIGREDKESERWGSEKKEPQKEKEKFNEKEKDSAEWFKHRGLWSGSDKEAPHTEKEPVEIPGKSSGQENSTVEQKKKDHDNWKNVDREARDKKKERDGDLEPERPDKRIRHQEKELEESVHVEGGTEREREVFSSGVQQKKRTLRPRGSPQLGNRDSRFRSGANDNEGSLGKAGVSCVVHKIGECMQELIKLWKEYESLQADKTCDGAQDGPTLEICIPAELVTATNRQVRGGQLWGTDVYTVDSDLVAVLMHTGYCRPTASPPPSATQELRATIRVLPPKDCYVSTLRNNVRSRAWGAAIGCSYRVERCCIVKKGGGIIDLEPCLTHSSTMEPTLAPVAVERTMTTRAAASNALRQQRFVREVTVQFNLCMEPWMKYSISAVADKGLKKSLFTSARLKKGEVLYVETHSRRYELCFNGEKVVKAASASHAHGSETGKPQSNNAHSANAERSAMDGESIVIDIFRWSRCKRTLPQKSMQSIGIPLPLEHVEVLEDNLEWDDIFWSQTGAWIGGKEYHLARVHFLSQN